MYQQSGSQLLVNYARINAMTDSTSSAVVYAYSLNFNMRSVLELDIYLYSSNIYISSTSNIGITATMKIAISNGVLNAVFMHSVG